MIWHVILSNIHFNILLHVGEYWFQYYRKLPKQPADGITHTKGKPKFMEWKEASDNALELNDESSIDKSSIEDEEESLALKQNVTEATKQSKKACTIKSDGRQNCRTRESEEGETRTTDFSICW